MRFVMLKERRCINCPCNKIIIELHVTRHESQVLLHVISHEQGSLPFICQPQERHEVLHAASHKHDAIVASLL
jgi:Fe-S-cluster-containing hydrogenase component 2